MRYIAGLILISLSGLLLLGFTTMPKAHHGHVDCVISSIDAVCDSGATNMAVHHVSAYNSFISVLLSIFSLLILALAFLVFVSPLFSLEPVRIEEKTLTPQSGHLRRWLSLFINSPTFN